MAFILLACGMALVSCKKTPLEVTSTEKRGLTTKDGEMKLFASSDEQFRGTSTAPYQDSPPSHWLVRPASQFRLLNYAFGNSGMGEVYVSQSQGSVLDNVNRWLKQFSQDDLSAEQLASLPKAQLLGSEAVIVEAKGLYASGMGKEPVDGFALAGLVARVGNDIITIKMIGPEAEVAAERAALLEYAKSLSARE